MDNLLHTATGKLLKTKLREQYRDYVPPALRLSSLPDASGRPIRCGRTKSMRPQPADPVPRCHRHVGKHGAEGRQQEHVVDVHDHRSKKVAIHEQE
ncbi:MAG TPA: hypothetical protein VMB75_10475 [Rhodocyclaceae bacterium]|nr:hypothetical protein [Rhodocyclaceae bacterium]